MPGGKKKSYDPAAAGRAHSKSSRIGKHVAAISYARLHPETSRKARRLESRTGRTKAPRRTSSQKRKLAPFFIENLKQKLAAAEAELDARL